MVKFRHRLRCGTRQPNRVHDPELRQLDAEVAVTRKASEPYEGNPGVDLNFLSRRRLNLDVHPSGEAQFVQGLDRARRRLLDIDQALVGADFKLLTSFLVNVGT